MAEKSILSYVHPKSRTPLVAIVLVTITSLFLLSFGAIEDIAYLTDFTVFAAFIAVNGSLIWLRYKKPKAKRPFKVPTLILPILGVISSFLIIFTIPLEIVFYGVGLIVLGIIIDEFIDF